MVLVGGGRPRDAVPRNADLFQPLLQRLAMANQVMRAHFPDLSDGVRLRRRHDDGGVLGRSTRPP